jgi:hypothetical protein
VVLPLCPRGVAMATRDPKREAYERLAGEYEVRVLEPSPPAAGPPDHADDPAARGHVPAGRRVVSPVVTGDLTWEDLAEDDAQFAHWAADRWLAAWRMLPPLPPDWPAQRTAMHTLAEHVVAPCRHAATGRIGLRWTRGGFGTPFFERDSKDTQVRVDGTDLVLDAGGVETCAPIETASRAAAFLGGPLGAPEDVYTPTTTLFPDAELRLSARSVAFLSDWFGFAWSVLEELRAEVADATAPSRVQIWPEHFDAAFEFGNEDEGRRAGYGASPGDVQHPDPYLYVVPWSDVPDDPVWNATSFRGAILSFSKVFASDTQRAPALGFMRDAARVLDEL